MSWTKALLTGTVGVVAAVGLLAMTTYPFDYRVMESVVLAGPSVLVTLYRPENAF